MDQSSSQVVTVEACACAASYKRFFGWDKYDKRVKNLAKT
jgi:hypothetical protein